MEKPKAGAEKCEEKKGAADRNCYRLTADPYSSSLYATQWGEGRRVGSEGLKLSLGRGGVGGWKVAYVLSFFLNTQFDFNLE